MAASTVSQSASTMVCRRARNSFSASLRSKIRASVRHVQELLLPGDRNHLGAPARLTELLPKAAVGLTAGVQLTKGSHARVDVDEDGRFRPNGNQRLEGEIMDQPLAWLV